MNKKEENPFSIPKDKLDLINEAMRTQRMSSERMYRPELTRRKPKYTAEDLKMVYKKIKKLSPMEVLEFNCDKKNPDEVSTEEIYNLFQQPEEIMVDEDRDYYVPLMELIKSGEIGKGDYLILLLTYLIDSYEDKDNTEVDKLNYKVRMVECQKLLEIFPPSNKAFIRAIRDDKYGKLYGDVIWRFSNDLIDKRDSIISEEFEKEFNTDGRKDILAYSNQSMTNEFITDDDVRTAFNTIVNENTNYKIAQQQDQTGTPLTEEQKREIYCEEFRKTLLKNYGLDSCIDDNHILLSYLYRYMCDIFLNGRENFKSGEMFDKIEDLERLLSIIQKKKEITCNISNEDFSEEELKQLEEIGIPTNVEGLNKAKIQEIISQILDKYCENAKVDILQDPQIINQTDSRILSRIKFSDEDIIKLDKMCDDATIEFLRKNCPGFENVLSEMKKNTSELTKEKIELLLKYGVISKKDIVDGYVAGSMPMNGMELLGEDNKDILPQMNYWKLISEYEDIAKITDPDKRAKAINLLKRKIDIYKLNLGDEFDNEIREKSYEFVVHRAEEYEDNKDKEKPRGISQKEILELYELGLVSLGSVVSLDSKLLYKLLDTDLPEDRKIAMSQIIDLYNNGTVLAKEIKDLFLDGSIPLYYIKDITELNLTKEEAMQLIEQRKITAQSIYSLYADKTISILDLEKYVDSLPSEEDKYMFIYGNFAGKGFEPVFNVLVDHIAAFTETHTHTGTGVTPIVPNPVVPKTEKPIPSKLRWEYLASLDPRFHIESLPSSYIAYIYPSHDRVILEQMRKKKNGVKVDSYGVASRGMTIDEYYYYKPQFIKGSRVSRKALVDLSNKGLIDSIEHFPTTWGKRVFENVNGFQVETIPDPNRKFEIEYMLEELKEEIEKSR